MCLYIRSKEAHRQLPEAVADEEAGAGGDAQQCGAHRIHHAPAMQHSSAHVSAESWQGLIDV